MLFYALFRLLGDPDVPSRSLWSGAVFGALGFEVLKRLSSLLLSTTEGQPAFQAFGIALILLVWINYFSRVVMYAASWAYTTAAARALRTEGPDLVQGPKVPSLEPLADGVPREDRSGSLPPPVVPPPCSPSLRWSGSVRDIAASSSRTAAIDRRSTRHQPETTRSGPTCRGAGPRGGPS